MNQRRIYWVFQKAYYRDKVYAYDADSLNFKSDTTIDQFMRLTSIATEEMYKVEDSLFKLSGISYKGK